MTVVFEAQPFIIFACGVACRVCSDDFIIIVRESRLYTTLCMDDVVERVAQHRPADFLRICCSVLFSSLLQEVNKMPLAKMDSMSNDNKFFFMFFWFLDVFLMWVFIG